jgi:hypothetical protein
MPRRVLTKAEQLVEGAGLVDVLDVGRRHHRLQGRAHALKDTPVWVRHHPLFEGAIVTI